MSPKATKRFTAGYLAWCLFGGSRASRGGGTEGPRAFTLSAHASMKPDHSSGNVSLQKRSLLPNSHPNPHIESAYGTSRATTKKNLLHSWNQRVFAKHVLHTACHALSPWRDLLLVHACGHSPPVMPMHGSAATTYWCRQQGEAEVEHILLTNISHYSIYHGTSGLVEQAPSTVQLAVLCCLGMWFKEGSADPRAHQGQSRPL